MHPPSKTHTAQPEWCGGTTDRAASLPAVLSMSMISTSTKDRSHYNN